MFDSGQIKACELLKSRYNMTLPHVIMAKQATVGVEFAFA